jgi:hypothetical protein
LIAGLFAVTALGLVLSIFIFTWTGFADRQFSASLCFNNDCVKNFFESFDQSFVILDKTFELLVSIATIGGIVVALMSYLSSASATALSNHIAHFTIFQTYMATEIARRNRISPVSIDNFVWYNLIFSNSRTGKTYVSDQYCVAVAVLNEAVNFSNEQAKTAAQGSFRYMPHQQRIINALLPLGITLTHQPRNEFYEVEDQIFSLIATLNKNFCYSDRVPELLKRAYV